MKPLERLTRLVGVRTGLIAFAAMMVLALSSASAHLVGSVTQTAPEAESVPKSAKEFRGASPYLELKDEPAPRLIVDQPLPDLLDKGVVWIQWRAENVNIVPVFGKGALNASPRVGHLHVQVDDLPWLWADASNINTIDMAGMPPGPHKVRIELVNANHEVFPGQSKIVTFTVPKGATSSHHAH